MWRHGERRGGREGNDLREERERVLTLHRPRWAGLIFRLPVETQELKNNLKQTASIASDWRRLQVPECTAGGQIESEIDLKSLKPSNS